MAIIEGFRVQNYRALKDVTLGSFWSREKKTAPLTPLTVVIGKNGAGKSSLFDSFGFLADCMILGVEAACDQDRRGGFERLRSQGSSDPIKFEIYYREAKLERPITYELAIDADKSGRPYVASEVLKQRRKNQKHGRPHAFLRLEKGEGTVWAGDDNVEQDSSDNEESSARERIELTDLRQLGIATLGTLKEHPRIKLFRDFIRGWYLSYFYPDAARILPRAGPQPHLNMHGDNMANVVQFMSRDHPERFKKVLDDIASKIPGVKSIETKTSDDKRLLLRFNDGAFKDPFYAAQMSDGTLKLFNYLLLLADADPPPLICIEEPENGLYHKLLDPLATEFREKASGKRNAPQIFVTTHQPYFLDALKPEEVWILKKGADGFSTIQRASDLDIVKNLVAEGLPLGGLWFADYLDAEA